MNDRKDPEYKDERKALARLCRRVYKKGFVAAYDGNLSLRLPGGSILITPSHRCKGEVRAADLLEITPSGELISPEGRISTESRIHLLAYEKRKDVNAVVHCHPVFATAFASCGLDMKEPVFPEVLLTLGQIPLCRYGTPSTDELPASMLEHIHTSDVMLLENHGAVALGHSLEDAYYKMEKLEHAAHTLFIARMLGGPNRLPQTAVEKLKGL